VVDEVEQASRRGHDDVGPATQTHHLRVDGHTAEHAAPTQRRLQVRGQLVQGLTDLQGQFARGHQHQHAGGAAADGLGCFGG
jgi:hypothetical protein